jgi:hypothetical protein
MDLAAEGGQGDDDPRAAVGRALDGDVAAVQGDDLLADVQPQPEPTRATRPRLVEAVEHLGAILGRDPDAVIAHAEPHLMVRRRGGYIAQISVEGQNNHAV